MEITDLPIDIILLISKFLELDMQKISMFEALFISEHFLPVLQNFYNYMSDDYLTATKLINRGYKLSISTNYKMLGQLSLIPNINNIYRLKLYVNPNTKIMGNKFIYNFTNLQELIIPYTYMDLNIVKIPDTLQKYTFYDKNKFLNDNKYEKYEQKNIECNNLFITTPSNLIDNLSISWLLNNSY